MKTNILGIPIHNLDLDEAARKIISRVKTHSVGSAPKYVATVNVDFLVNALSWIPGKVKCQELHHVLTTADLTTADGMPLVWLSKILGDKLKERVTGADLVPRLIANAANEGISIFFLGGREGSANIAAKRLSDQTLGLKIGGCLSPMLDINKINRDVINKINKSGSGILLIALGNPKQEIWFNRNKHLIRVPVCIGVGGTFEFIAGKVSRSPVWMQKTGLEWFYRLCQEPKRLWKRYCLNLVKFGFLAGCEIMKHSVNSFLNGFYPIKIRQNKNSLNNSIRG
jgi:N-acetylglucosaminyldiphosphoundecaprenol N-acetyl-beta-D-mannosaminyltransferase